jgi:hypothetical protein
VKAALEQLQKTKVCALGVKELAVAWGQFVNPGRGTSAAGSHYQRTGKGQHTKKTQCTCSR